MKMKFNIKSYCPPYKLRAGTSFLIGYFLKSLLFSGGTFHGDGISPGFVWIASIENGFTFIAAKIYFLAHDEIPL
jgi:hypothetical protein